MVAKERPRSLIWPEPQQAIDATYLRENIFKGKEGEMFGKLNSIEIEYLVFVAVARQAMVGGHADAVKSFISAKKKELGGTVFALAKTLASYIVIIQKAIPLPVSTLSGKVGDHGEVRSGELEGNDETPEEYSDPTTSSLWVQ